MIMFSFIDVVRIGGVLLYGFFCGFMIYKIMKSADDETDNEEDKEQDEEKS